MTVGRTFDDATEAFVAEATLADGTPAVLKLLVPRGPDVARHEITVLRLADGDGCARLLRATRRATRCLLERLGRSLFELELPIDRRHAILCATAARVWRPAPGAGCPPAPRRAGGWSEYITRARGRSSTDRARQRGRARASRARHGASPRTTTSAPCSCTATCTSGTRSRPATASSSSTPTGCSPRPSTTSASSCGRTRSSSGRRPVRPGAWLAARTGLDATAIWEWGVVERVSTGLLATRIGLQPVGREMLATADALSNLADVPDGRPRR